LNQSPSQGHYKVKIRQARGKIQQKAGRGVLSSRPVIWIRKGYYWDLLFFEISKKLYAFRSMDVERLERNEILAIPVYQVLEKTISS